jgi:AcrR family transcriptional regulator
VTADHATVGLRERKKAETREALSSAALRLAVELGPDGVTVDAIADAAGVSARTFFNYFASKEDAILGNTSVSTSRLVEQLVGRPRDEPPLVALRAAVHATVDHLQSDPDDWFARSRLVRSYPELSVRYAARLAALERELVLEIAARTGLDADRDPYPGVVAGATMAAARVALTIWQERGSRDSLPALLDEVFDSLAAGLRPPAPPAARRRRRRS